MVDRLVFSISIMLFFCLISCKKYEEGGNTHAAEKKITNAWVMTKACVDELQRDTLWENPQIGKVNTEWVFYNDFTFKTNDGIHNLYGNWKFINDFNAIQISVNSPDTLSSNFTYDIIKLKVRGDEGMIWEQFFNEKLYRYELELYK